MIVIDKLQKVAAARGLSLVDAVQLEVGGDTVAALRARGRHSGSSPWLTFESAASATADSMEQASSNCMRSCLSLKMCRCRMML